MTQQTLREKIQEIKKPKYENASVLETKLCSRIYRQLLDDGIADGQFWIADIAIGMHNLFIELINKEVIGGDELRVEIRADGKQWPIQGASIRNELRASQRQKLQQLKEES